MIRKTLLFAMLIVMASCNTTPPESSEPETMEDGFILEAESAEELKDSSTSDIISLSNGESLTYKIEVPSTGRYRVEAHFKGPDSSFIWVEDYIDNKDDRTYNITGRMHPANSKEIEVSSKDGSPLKAGSHLIEIHAEDGDLEIDKLVFSLFQEHLETPKSLTQNMDGEDWKLVWSDEFDGTGLADSTKWAYNVGNWGWGNNEPQYYTNARAKNARQENGNLIIEAHKNDMDQAWTSARLTTQGKQSFLYGKIEFRAKVPTGRGTWAAGWLLGDSYKDELSWPYCGEIDVLECVGFEINDATGNGINHATCHTPKYYFKKGNQIGSQIDMENMNNEFHTYTIEWYPDVIYGLVDGERYYTYDKNADDLEWPFHQAQNIILNLAVGGGWGGAKGIDENWENHQYIIDYVRVYELTDKEN